MHTEVNTPLPSSERADVNQIHIDPEDMDKLRAEQEVRLTPESGHPIPLRSKLGRLAVLRKFTRHKVDQTSNAQSVEQINRDFIARTLPGIDAHAQANVSRIVNRYSIDRMSSDEWMNGKQMLGKTIKRPGRERFEQDVEHVNRTNTLPSRTVATNLGSRPPEYLPADAHAEFDVSMDSVVELRNRAAALSIRLRQKMTLGGRNREMQEAYRATLAAYESAYIGHAKLLAQYRSDTEPSTQLGTIVSDLLEEKQRFHQAEAAFLDQQHGTLSKLSRVLGKNRNLYLSSITTGVVLGGVTRLALRGSGAVLIGVAAPAAIAGALAIKSTQGILHATIGNRTQLMREHAKRHEEDVEYMSSQLGDSPRKSVFPARDSQNLLSHTLMRRVEKDQSSNKRRVAIAAALGGLAGGATMLMPSINIPGIDLNLPQWRPQVDIPGFNWLNPDIDIPKPDLNPSPPPLDVDPNAPPIDTPPDASIPDSDDNGTGQVAGFDSKITVESGHSITEELQDLAEQKGVNLSGADAWRAYLDLEKDFGSDMFVGNEVYTMPDGHLGLASSGTATWNNAAVLDFQSWLEDNKLVEAA